MGCKAVRICELMIFFASQLCGKYVHRACRVRFRASFVEDVSACYGLFVVKLLLFLDEKLAIPIAPMHVWSGLCVTQPALGIQKLPWGQHVFPGLDLKKKIINNLKFLCSLHLWTCRDQWRLQPWKRCNSVPTVTFLLVQSVAVFPQFLPLIENVYHLLNFLLSRRVRESSFLWSVRVGLITILYFIVLKNALFCFPNLSLS